MNPRFSEGPSSKHGIKYWHPDGGYGFFVRPSEVMVKDTNRYMDTTSMSLLKLHGSINWYPRNGEKPPFSLSAICHHQNWYPPNYPSLPTPDPGLLARLLEPDPFLIPPVLDKSALVNEPVLQVVWSQAKESLRSGPIRLNSCRSFLSGVSADAYAASLPVGSITVYASSGVCLPRLECGLD